MKFLRHFQTEVEPNIPVSKWQLSDKGKSDMQEFVKNTKFNVSIVYTSTEPKAAGTAKLISDKCSAKLVKTDLLREIDRSEEGFVKNHDKYIELAEDYLTGGNRADWENQEKVRQRFQNFVEMAEKDSLAITHGLFLALNISDTDPVSFWNELGFGQIVHYDF